MKSIATILGFILGLLLLYITYTIINIGVTIIRKKRKDHTFEFCFSKVGILIYLALLVFYVLFWIIDVLVFIQGIKINNYSLWLNALAILTLYSLAFSMMLGNTVLIGKKQMMVGRLEIDYRKMKKVNIDYHKQMSFVYAQQSYKFSTRFVDVSRLRRAITRRG